MEQVIKACQAVSSLRYNIFDKASISEGEDQKLPTRELFNFNKDIKLL